jgi:hypothetical protein
MSEPPVAVAVPIRARSKGTAERRRPRRQVVRGRNTRRWWGIASAVTGTMLVGILLVGPAAPVAVAAPTSWSVVPSPNVGPHGKGTALASVYCLSASFCMAAGYYVNSSNGFWPPPVTKG